MVNNKNNFSVSSSNNLCILDHFRNSKILRGNLSMSISQQLAKPQSNNQYIVAPQSLTEAMEYAKLISSSNFCPTNMKGKPGDVLIAMQMGAEVGLSPMQALQNIAIINSRPCIWGDAALALVQASPLYVSHREWEEGSAEHGTLIAYCAVIRKGSDEYIKSFSQKEAEKAGLWKKAGVWQQYPSRMLQMRARSFCLRDKFADALRGLSVREEVEDYDIDKTYHHSKVVSISPKVNAIEQVLNEYDHDAFMSAVSDINNCSNEEDLRKVFTEAYKNPKIVCNIQAKNNLVKVKDERKLKIGREEFLAEYDAVTGEVSEDSKEVSQ